MKVPRLAYKGRKLRRLSVVSGLSVLMLVAFGASFALAQESRTFLPWSTLGNGAAQLTSTKNIMRGVVGQNAVGRTFSDDDLDERFEVILGFQTRALASEDAFAELIAQLALTPIATPVPAATQTPTPMPTAVATSIPVSPTATAVVTAVASAVATATPVPVGNTPTPIPATSTPFPRLPTATLVPASQVPTAVPTVEPTPVVIVTTTVPEPTETPLPAPEATATPFILVVTSVPEPEPSPTIAPPPPPSGGICSAPSRHGPSPLDLGWLMLLVAPLALWRFGKKP